MRIKPLPSAALAFGLIVLAAPALAVPCQNDTPFEPWLDGLKRDAAAQGLSQRTLSSALNGVTPDPSVVRRDRSQRVFKQSFEQFAGRMVSSYRVQRGKSLLRQQAALFDRIEQRFGVPGAVVVALWGLETDFGANRGNASTLRSLVTLAYDCRRAPMFRNELISALKVIERGDLSAGEMRGGWHGELGQTQFMASSYAKYAVDFDGNGRADLLRSVPDVLASTANYLKGYGWQRGGAWTPGSANYGVLQQWNKSQVYARTIALMATRLDGGSTAEASPAEAAPARRRQP